MAQTRSPGDHPSAPGPRSSSEQRLVLIGAGWISGYHLAALDRLGRTRLAGVLSGRLERAREIARPRGAQAYGPDQLERMLDTERPDLAIVCVPPAQAIGLLDPLVERRIPFLTEKPLAASEAAGPERLAGAIEASGLVAGVGYHLRGLEALSEVRNHLRDRPAQLLAARWLGDTPPPAWWRNAATGGGQVIEQVTHFYDLARLLLGEATVVRALATMDQPPVPEGTDLADGTVALLRFESGAIGTIANSRRLAGPAAIEFEIVSPGLLIAIRKLPEAQTTWQVSLDDGRAVRVIPPGRDPYEVQDEAFLDAVEAGDPGRVLSSYADALRTDRLTRSVVAAAGRE
jgi:myo-inositol 2-dehydrogenase / D-chiro-inositol 1-dehydrogenase